MVQTLSKNSPIRKVLTGQLEKDHILQGLKARYWIPVVSSPEILKETDLTVAKQRELVEVMKVLKTCIPGHLLPDIPIGRDALLKELKMALLKAIMKTQAGIQERIGNFTSDLDKQLAKLPRIATIAEKRQIFDLRLKVLEEHLNNLVGASGRHSSDDLRMKLMVHAPKQFEKDLVSCTLRGDIHYDVKQILNQAALEAGGSFDSDLSFNNLSRKIIERYEKPCRKLVLECSNIILTALKDSVDKTFGEYKALKNCVIRTLGLPDSQDFKSGPKTATGGPIPPVRMFEMLQRSAVSKVESLLDAHRTMICFHPMWRNFDTLYRKILLTKKSSGMVSSIQSAAGLARAGTTAEDTLQRMLDLPALAVRVCREGQNAVKVFEAKSGQTISDNNKEKVRRHFARVEVMGYIIRMSLMGSVFPIILRDLRDGLFKGVKCGLTSWNFSVSRLLRTKLLFDPAKEKQVFTYMDPSAEDSKKRQALEDKRATLVGLQGEFHKCQAKLQLLRNHFE
jgi:hypothetical protein